MDILNNRWLLMGGLGLTLLISATFLTQGSAESTAALTVHPEEGPFRVTVTSTGELRAQNSVQIKGPTRARQARIYELQILRMVPEGTIVEKGDFVAELDRSELNNKLKDARLDVQDQQAQYEQAQIDTSLTLTEARDRQVDLRFSMEEAELRKEQSEYEAPSVKRQAQIDYDKAKRAYEQAVVSYQKNVRKAEAKMREVETDLMKARRQYEEREALAGQFTIHAPEDGMLIYRRGRDGRKVKEGSTVRVWNPVVATLPDLSVMESITYINEVDIRKIEEGQPAEIGLDANTDKKLTGTVTEVANIGQQRPGSDAKVFRVAIAINEADTTLRPAMTTSNTIIVDRVPKSLHVPLETIRASGDSLTYVFKKEGGQPMRQEVRLGAMNANRVVIQEGLDAEDTVYLSTPADTSKLSLQRLKTKKAMH